MPLNLCRACGQDFSGLETFDRHRVGKHAYLWSPAREDGRRCLDSAEMGALGWTRNARGQWRDPARSPAGRLRERPEPVEAA